MERTLSPDADCAVHFSALPPHGSDSSFACGRCTAPMERSELRFPPRTMVSRVGSPVRPARVLPTWRCTQCGLHQPRLEA
jgi:heterodisulfide reductase subunit C